MCSLALRRTVLVLVLTAAGAWLSIGAQVPTLEGPTYSLTATIPIGLQPYTDVDVDPATGRAYLAIRDGLRVVDTRSGELGPQQTQLEMSGSIELAPDIDRIFAELDDDYIGFIDLRSYSVDRAVSVKYPGRLVYEPATQELYVFSDREPRVLVLDGRTGEQRRVIELPGWGGDGILKTPGKIYVVVRPERQLYVIDTEDRVALEFPMSKPLTDPPLRFTLVADTEGRTLFAKDRYDIVAIDAETGERLASVRRRTSTLMYDDAAGVLLAHTSEPDWPQMKFISYRLDSDELVRVSEQHLPREGGLFPFPTAFGFVSGFFTGSISPRPGNNFRRSHFTVWQRDGASN